MGGKRTFEGVNLSNRGDPVTDSELGTPNSIAWPVVEVFATVSYGYWLRSRYAWRDRSR